MCTSRRWEDKRPFVPRGGFWRGALIAPSLPLLSISSLSLSPLSIPPLSRPLASPATPGGLIVIASDDKKCPPLFHRPVRYEEGELPLFSPFHERTTTKCNASASRESHPETVVIVGHGSDIAAGPSRVALQRRDDLFSGDAYREQISRPFINEDLWASEIFISFNHSY